MEGKHRIQNKKADKILLESDIKYAIDRNPPLPDSFCLETSAL